MQLDIHLEGHHNVRFDPNDREGTAILINNDEKGTKLLAFFQLCASDPVGTAQLIYPDVPESYRWIGTRWVRRIHASTAQVGRVYFVPQSAGPKFYLRLLLHHVQSPKSFADVRTYLGIHYDTYREACEARGLLIDDAEWNYCLADAALLQPGAAMRRLYCSIILQQRVDRPAELYEAHKESLADDCRYRLQRRGIPDPSYERCLSLSRALLRDIFASMNADFDIEQSGVPPPDEAYSSDVARIPVAVLEEVGYNRASQQVKADQMVSRMTSDQLSVYNSVKSAIDDPSTQPSTVFFLDGPGGCGKTFVENALLAYTRGKGKVGLAVAASGIAALMLEGGRTAHSRFGIPLTLSASSACHISATSAVAQLLKATDVVIWDEAPMQNSFGIEAVDRLLQDLRKSSKPFGGVVVLFSGDWRQTLPIVRGGTTSETLRACLHHSYLWSDITQLRLKTNLRLLRTVQDLPAHVAAAQIDYAAWTMAVGDGTAPTDDEGRIEVPARFRLCASTPEPLVSHLYKDIPSNPLSDHVQDYWSSRAILHALNVDVDATNEDTLQKLPGQIHTFTSADTALTDDGDVSPAFAAEYLATQTPSGSPPHVLNLKIGAPVMLLRNFDPINGLCNGTRLIVRAVRRNALLLTIISGAEDRIDLCLQGLWRDNLYGVMYEDARKLPDISHAVWSHIFDFLPRTDLPSVMLTCRTFYDVSAQLLYRRLHFHIDDIRFRRCLISLGRNAFLARIPRTVCIVSDRHQPASSCVRNYQQAAVTGVLNVALICGYSDEATEFPTYSIATERVRTSMAEDEKNIDRDQLTEEGDHALFDNDSAEFTDDRSRNSEEDSTATSQLSLNSLDRRGRVRPQVLRRSVRIRDREQQRLREAQARQQDRHKRATEDRRRRFRLSDSEEGEYTPPSEKPADKEKGPPTGKKSRKKTKAIDVSQPRRQVPDTAAGRIESEFEMEWLDGSFKKIVIYRQRAPPMGVGSSSRLRLTPPLGSGTELDPFLLTDTGSVVDPESGADGDDEYTSDGNGHNVDAGLAQRATEPSSPVRTADEKEPHPFPSLLVYESD
ncbi:hypothetical protein A4X13_0g2571 [Tilletia indica]|uniref:ATP-dependent DNA helicase n=1 Tax=Tilletia indica TaxID=43049 RepID=A0A8T8T9N2_9BASI|nr:hypothetical protein A4X13_0g2571 [Tilletia indica]